MSSWPESVLRSEASGLVLCSKCDSRILSCAGVVRRRCLILQAAANSVVSNMLDVLDGDGDGDGDGDDDEGSERCSPEGIVVIAVAIMATIVVMVVHGGADALGIDLALLSLGCCPAPALCSLSVC